MHRKHPYSQYLSNDERARVTLRTTPARFWEKRVGSAVCIGIFIAGVMAVTMWLAVNEVKDRAAQQSGAANEAP